MWWDRFAPEGGWHRARQRNRERDTEGRTPSKETVERDTEEGTTVARAAAPRRLAPQAEVATARVASGCCPYHDEASRSVRDGRRAARSRQDHRCSTTTCNGQGRDGRRARSRQDTLQDGVPSQLSVSSARRVAAARSSAISSGTSTAAARPRASPPRRTRARPPRPLLFVSPRSRPIVRSWWIILTCRVLPRIPHLAPAAATASFRSGVLPLLSRLSSLVSRLSSLVSSLDLVSSRLVSSRLVSSRLSSRLVSSRLVSSRLVHFVV